MVSTPVGSPEYWRERVLQHALLARAFDVGTRIAAYVQDPANTPHQLITGSRRALADLTAHIARTDEHAVGLRLRAAMDRVLQGTRSTSTAR